MNKEIVNKKPQSQSKYYNTACMMDAALIRLLEKKDFEYITVKELCEVAGVNRSTFYLHYETMDDLLVESIEFVGQSMSAKFSQGGVINSKQLDSCSQEELILITPKYLLPYLEFVKENKSVFIAASDKPEVFRTKSILGYLQDTVFGPILTRYNVPENEQEYRIAFYLSGVWAIISKWISSNCKEDVETIAQIIIKCVGL